MTNNYAKAYTEVLEILSHFSDEEYSKIPIEKIEFYKNNMDKGYIYKIDPEIDLSKQVISDEANAILISLFKDYFATEKQKEKLKKLLIQNQNRLEEIKREKYNPNNLFENRQEETLKDSKTSEISLRKYNKEPIFTRIRKIIKELFINRGKR